MSSTQELATAKMEGGCATTAKNELTTATTLEHFTVQSKILGNNNNNKEENIQQQIHNHPPPPTPLTPLQHATTTTTNLNKSQKPMDLAPIQVEIPPENHQFYNTTSEDEPGNMMMLSSPNGSFSPQIGSKRSASAKNFGGSDSPMLLDDRRLRRQIANCNERRRMQSINAGFQALRQFLPQRSGEKLSKAAILQQTAELIQELHSERRVSSKSKDSETRCKSASDAMREDPEPQPPHNKKRRIVIKNERKDVEMVEARPEQDTSILTAKIHHLETQIADYLKIIEELRAALGKEQQLRVLYEQKLSSLREAFATNLDLTSNGGGAVDCNEGLHQTAHLTHQQQQQQRSNSADASLLMPKPLPAVNPLAVPTPLNNNNLSAALSELIQFHQQQQQSDPLRMVHQQQYQQQLMASQLVGSNSTYGTALPLASPQSQQLANPSNHSSNVSPTGNHSLRGESMFQNSLVSSLNGQLLAQTLLGQLSGHHHEPSTDRNTLISLLQTLHQQIDADQRSKGFPVGEPLSADVLVR